MKKETLEKAKETLLEEVIKKIKKGEVSLEFYNIISSEIFNIEKKDKDSEYNKNKKELADLMSRTFSI